MRLCTISILTGAVRQLEHRWVSAAARADVRPRGAFLLKHVSVGCGCYLCYYSCSLTWVVSLVLACCVRRLSQVSLSLLPALGLLGCSSASLPKLTDLEAGAPPQKVAALPQNGSPVPNSQPPPSTSQPQRLPAAQDMIVGFKGQTIILFGDEFGHDGERVATAELNLPLQMKSSSSNAPRVQIDTAYGPRWVARSEIKLGVSDSQLPRRR